MRICLFEDSAVADLEPLTLTRPVFELVCGQTSLGSKQCRYFAPCEVGVLVRPYLADLVREQTSTPVNDLDWLRSGPVVLVNGRWLPPPVPAVDLASPCVARLDSQVAFAVLGPEQLADCSVDNLAACLESWKETLPSCPAGGCLVRHLWELIEHNGEQLCLDFAVAAPRYPRTCRPTLFGLVGPADRLLVDPSARIDPLVVADTHNGPVVIDHDAVVQAFSRLEGPCYVGPHSMVLGAKVRAGTTIGPGCRVGGEVEASILHGHSNKYHDGFLGHSYLGEWVNLGAGTQNSDLRNDYGPVTMTVNGQPVCTGRTKVGCFIGDHAKTGLGTLLNTGSSIGAFCNLLPTGYLLPRYVPSFCNWWNGTLTENADLGRLFATAEAMMRRRGCTFTPTHADMARALFDRTAPQRRQMLRDAEQRRLRRSA